MWVTTTTYAVIYALLSWVVLCWVRIWSCDCRGKTSNPICVWFVLTIQRVFLIVYAFLGLYLLDIVAQICFSGLISYGSVSYIAAPVILCTSLGVLYVIRCAFTRPTWATCLSLYGMMATYLYTTEYVPGSPLRMALYTGIGLTVILNGVDFLVGTRRRTSDPNIVLREEEIKRSVFVGDLSRAFERVMSTKIYVTVLLLLSIELVLLFEGRSLFFWIKLD